MLEQCYSLSKRCRNDVVKLCCAKNSSLQIVSCKITFKQRRQRRQRERKKATGLDQQNKNFARASCFFAHFLAVDARLRHETSKFRAPALELVNTTQTWIRSFRIQPQRISPTFDKLNEIE